MIDLKSIKFSDIMKNPQLKEYFVAGVILFIAIIYLFFGTIPSFGKLSAVSSDLSDTRHELDVARKRIVKMKGDKDEISELTKNIENLSKDISGKEEMAMLLEDFASMANASGVKIKSITPFELRQMELSKHMSEMPIKITAKSGYHQLGDFVSKLGNQDRIIVIEDISIKYDGSSPKLHNIIIKLKTFVSS